MAKKQRHWRITASVRERELATLVMSTLTVADRRRRALIHTYPYLSVSAKIARALVDLEKGEGRFINHTPNRLEKILNTIKRTHEDFDREHKWSDGYNHDPAAAEIADSVVAAEVKA